MTMMTTTDKTKITAVKLDKVRENRLRQMAKRQGLNVRKTRRRDPLATDYGTYALVELHTGRVTAPRFFTIDQLEAYLLDPEEPE